MTTPMRRQYLQLKSQHPDCILFFRLGDFYEAFDSDAETVAAVCDVVLTSRPVGNNQRVPLAGVPYHSVEGYLARLVEAGYKVAVAEQVSEPGAGLVEREIQQVITKGTIAEPSMLADDRNNYLVAVLISAGGNEAGIAYCDITTGEFAATQINSSDFAETERRLEDEVGRLQPSELITSEWKIEESGLAPLIDSLQAIVSQVEAWQVELDTARSALQRHLGVRSLDGFGLQEQPQAVRAAAAILAYLQEMQPSALSQLVRLHSYSLSEFMALDESTRRNLELTETMRGGEVAAVCWACWTRRLLPWAGGCCGAGWGALCSTLPKSTNGSTRSRRWWTGRICARRSALRCGGWGTWSGGSTVSRKARRCRAICWASARSCAAGQDCAS